MPPVPVVGIDGPVGIEGVVDITSGTAFIGEGNKGIARMNFLNADICLATTPELDVLQWKRSKLCKYYVHIPHTVDDLSGYRMFGLDFYDAVLTTGRNQNDFIRKIELLRPNTVKKELCVVGSPNLDSMRNRASEKNTEKKQNSKKTVLVAPSWGKSGILTLSTIGLSNVGIPACLT